MRIRSAATATALVLAPAPSSPRTATWSRRVRGADGSADPRLGTGATARRVGVAGDGTLWRGDNEAGAALALSPLGDGSFEAQTFRRGATGWAAAGWLGRSGTLFGCVGEDCDSQVRRRGASFCKSRLISKGTGRWSESLKMPAGA